jgi:hypothetical protein
MNNIIIIGFVNDDRTYELPKEIIKFYPNSILSLYGDVIETETNEKIIITEMIYEQFQIVYDVIIGKQKQWLVSPEILKFLDKYGLVDDTLLKLQNNIDENMNNECIKIDNFINSNDAKILLADTVEQYDRYKKIFEHDKNIMSIQLSYKYDRLICINILESVPICYSDNVLSNDIIIQDVMDINMMRYHILVKNIGCQDCNICNECDPLNIVKMTCENCKICIECTHFYNNTNYKNKDKFHYDEIYNTNNSIYLDTLCNLLYSVDDFSLFQKIKSTDTNFLKWSDVTIPEFTDNINNSLNKIINVIFGGKKDIKKYYNGLLEKSYYHKTIKIGQDCNDPNDIIIVFYGFLNIRNILK